MCVTSGMCSSWRMFLLIVKINVCVCVFFSSAFREQGNMTDLGGQVVMADNFPIKLTKWCPLQC